MPLPSTAAQPQALALDSFELQGIVGFGFRVKRVGASSLGVMVLQARSGPRVLRANVSFLQLFWGPQLRPPRAPIFAMSVTCTETLPTHYRGSLSYGSGSPKSERIGSLSRSHTFGLGDSFDAESSGSGSGSRGSQAQLALEERMAPLPSLCLVMYSGFLSTLALDIVVTTVEEYSRKLGAGALFSGLVIALTPLLQGLIGVPLNRWMLKSASMKTVSILMAAGMVVGHIIYALAGLMHSKLAVLFARALIGVCQFQLGAPIYIADAVGVKRRTPVLFVYSAVATSGLAVAPAICGLIETFLHELRVHNLVLDSDTAPGWFMAICILLVLVEGGLFLREPRKGALTGTQSCCCRIADGEAGVTVDDWYPSLPLSRFCKHYDEHRVHGLLHAAVAAHLALELGPEFLVSRRAHGSRLRAVAGEQPACEARGGQEGPPAEHAVNCDNLHTRFPLLVDLVRGHDHTDLRWSAAPPGYQLRGQELRLCTDAEDRGAAT